MNQAILNFQGEVYYFEPNPGSDIWPHALMPTSVPIGNAQDNLPAVIRKYGLVFRIGSERLSVRATMLGDDLLDNINAAFRYIEATDHVVTRLLVNDQEVDGVIKSLGDMAAETDRGVHIWTAIILSSDVFPAGFLICETDAIFKEEP